MIEAGALRDKLQSSAPHLWEQACALTVELCLPLLAQMDRAAFQRGFPKAFNDPVWGVIELLPWETALLDSPLLQRLRGVRQLGMAHYVYPGAGHDRLEHSRGVVEAAERMICALARNAAHRRNFGETPDAAVPEVEAFDRNATRLAALLHDVGHGPFSHATEHLLGTRFSVEFDLASQVLRDSFAGSTKIETSECLAVLMVMSPAMDRVFTHGRFGAIQRPTDLAPAIASRILGSRACLKATYLSGVVSGPLDADKLDYMARDSHHAGLGIALDLNRLISKLEVVIVTTDNAPNPELKKRAEETPGHRFYEIGLSLSGLSAYEQMIISRVLLYDRLYFHHKVRAAEGMLRRLILLAEEEREQPFSLRELMMSIADDGMLGLLGGELKHVTVKSGGVRSKEMASALNNRRLYFRAFAFAARFIQGLDRLEDDEQKDTRAYIWSRVRTELSTPEGCSQLAHRIFRKAQALGESIDDLRPQAVQLRDEHVLVDMPTNTVVVRGSDILTLTTEGHVQTPNLFFNPERWSQAYEHQKQCGYVFAPRESLELVALASRIVFFDEFELLMKREAHQVCKLSERIQKSWIDQAVARRICSAEFAKLIAEHGSRLISFKPEEIELPSGWDSESPDRRRYLATELNRCLPFGLSMGPYAAFLSSVFAVCNFVKIAEENGRFAKTESLRERELQEALLDYLRGARVVVAEGVKIGGGESDLVLNGSVVVENKVAGRCVDPFAVKLEAGWQARRYSIAILSSVAIVLLAYQPAGEHAVLPQSHRIRVESLHDGHATIRVVVPYGHGVPSHVKVPEKG
ncbi:MAG: HD domain-containing protein [Acidobacteria bacterium]|nr:HD domain-containing protein [Acidobacteriota bacterium]